MSLAMIALPFCQTYECVMASSVFWGFFAGGIPGNGPMVYSESFKKDLASSQGLASIGRALAALSMGPLASNLLLKSFIVQKFICNFKIDKITFQLEVYIIYIQA